MLKRGLVVATLLAILLAGCATPEAPSPQAEPTATAAHPQPDESEGDLEEEPTSMPTSSSASATSTPANSASSSTTSQAPQKDASLLVLVAIDMGSGWGSDPVQDAPGQAPNSTDDAVGFTYKESPYGTPRSVDSTAWVFTTPAAARAYFDSAKADLSDAPLQDVDAGDDAFVWVQSPGRWEEGWVLKDNVVWDLYVVGDGGTPSPTTTTLLRRAVAKL